MKFLNSFAVILVFMIFVFFGMIVLKINSVGQAVHDVMLMIIGALTSTFTLIVQYYFGSSQGSAKKNDTINSMLNKTKES